MRMRNARPFVLPAITVAGSLWLLIPLVFGTPGTAHAYIDPSTGSYVVQIIFGAVLGGTYACKRFIAAAVAKIKNRRNPSGSTTPTDGKEKA
jgi:hypothetical protein